MQIKKILSGILTLSLITSSVVFADNISLNPEVRVPELRATALDEENVTDIGSYDKANELLMNLQYNDVSEDANKEAIYQLAAEGVYKSPEGGSFYPGVYTTKQEMLKYLVRMSGNEAAVQQRLTADAAGLNAASYDSQLVREYIDEALTLGILIEDEDSNMPANVTREQAAVWISRALGLAPVYGDQNIVYSFNDFGEVLPVNRGIVESVLNEGIMEVDSAGQFNPDQNITNSQMAALLQNVTEQLYDNRNLQGDTAIVTGINPQVNGDITYVLKDLDGALTNVTVAAPTTETVATDFVVSKDGMPGLSNTLALGDEVDYILQDNAMLFAHALSESSIVQALANAAQDETDVRVYFGTIYSKKTENHYDGDQQTTVERVRVQNYNGQVFDFVVETDQATGIRNDINVIKGEQSGGVDLLSEGDALEYIVKDGVTLLLATTKPVTSSTVKGTIQQMETDANGQSYVTVLDYSNNIVRYPIAQYADIAVNTEVGTVDDLQYGQDVTLSVQNGYVIYLAGETYLNPGYIPANGKSRMGRVEAYSNGYMTLLQDDGTQEVVLISEATMVKKNDVLVSSALIRTGDRVKVYFSDPYSQMPTMVEIEGPEQLITGVYKGKFFKVNRANKSITLTQSYQLENSQWISTDQFAMEIQVDDNAKIYYGGQPIAFNVLSSSMQGMDLYLAVKDDYNNNQAIQVLVKNGGERVYYSAIDTLNRAVSRFEMDNAQNVNFNDGTIFVRNDRLVSKNAMALDENALIVTNFKNGQNYASVVELHGINTSTVIHAPYYVYIGYLETIYSSMFNLDHSANMSGYSWNEADDDNNIDFTYGYDTIITDVTDDDPVRLSNYQFFNGSYMREENEDEDDEGLDYERYYAFVVADENGEALNVMIRKEALIEDINIDDEIDRESEVEDEMNDIINRLVYTKGQVVSIDTDWNRLELKNSFDWLSYYNEWNDNRTDTYIELGDTIIMKGDETIDFEDIEVGDEIKAIRYNEDAIIVFVE